MNNRVTIYINTDNCDILKNSVLKLNEDEFEHLIYEKNKNYTVLSIFDININDLVDKLLDKEIPFIMNVSTYDYGNNFITVSTGNNDIFTFDSFDDNFKSLSIPVDILNIKLNTKFLNAAKKFSKIYNKVLQILKIPKNKFKYYI